MSHPIGAVVMPNIDCDTPIIAFAAEGVGHEFIRDGWGANGTNDAWTVGHRAEVELPHPDTEHDYSLTLDVSGVAASERSAPQRIVAIVNKSVIGQVVCRGAARYEFYVPAHVLRAKKKVTIEFELPNACRPIDFGLNQDRRFLAIRVSRLGFRPFHSAEIRLQLEHREMLMNMQTLGINCEFAFLQRSVGAEPLGLFRWTFAPLAKLLPAIEQGFQGLGSAGSLQVHIDRATEFIVRDTIYGFQYHSFVYENKGGTLQEVLKNEHNRLTYLSRSLLEEMRERTKLFVFHDAEQSNLEEVRKLVRAINSYGTNSLLWIVGTSEKLIVGTARLIEPCLIQGYVSGFQTPVDSVLPTSVHQPSWLSAATQAYKIWVEAKMLQPQTV
jgi:hypothetical protein